MTKHFSCKVVWLLNNPEYFNKLEEGLEGPDAGYLETAFHTLLDEAAFFNENTTVVFKSLFSGERIQIILDTGHMVELQVEPDYLCDIKNEQEFSITSRLYYAIVRAIEDLLPEDCKYNICLTEPPTPSTGFLTNPEDEDSFVGEFYHLDKPEQIYSWKVTVVDADTETFRAEILV
jgi:hypothetical protein